MKNIFITLSNEEWQIEVESILKTRFESEDYNISQLAPVSIKTEIEKTGNIIIIDSRAYNLNKPFEMIQNFEVHSTILYVDLDTNFKFDNDSIIVFDLLNDLYHYCLTGKKNEEKQGKKERLLHEAEEYIKKHESIQGNDEEIEIEIGNIKSEKNNDDFVKRANSIRKHSFHQAPYNTNKTIGVWSPLHRMGVTQFVLNFSIYLAQFRLPVAVLEAPNNVQNLKHLLLQFTEMPQKWSSYATALSNEGIPPDRVKWIYKNVHWIPLDYDDSSIEWKEDMLFHYINNLKYFDVLMIDLPTSKMENYTVEISEQLDELWVLVDDSYIQLKGWKEYIHTLQSQLNIPCYLIFNKANKHSKPQLIEEELELPLLTEIPSVFDELQINNYEIEPIILNQSVNNKLYDSYFELAKHILGDIEPKSKGLMRNLIERILK